MKNFQAIYLYGKHTTLAFLTNSSKKLENVYCTTSVFTKYKAIISRHNYHVSTDLELSNMLPAQSSHQGIIIKTMQPLTSPTIDQSLLNKDKSLIIILDHVQDTGNVGAIIRNAVAFGADVVVTTNRYSPSNISKLAKSAAGSMEKISLVTVPNIVNVINLLKKHNYWIIGLDGQAQEQISETHFAKKTALICGSENQGMRQLVKKHCDHLLQIPITNIESLNVSCASAIACYVYRSSN